MLKYGSIAVGYQKGCGLAVNRADSLSLDTLQSAPMECRRNKRWLLNEVNSRDTNTTASITALECYSTPYETK